MRYPQIFPAPKPRLHRDTLWRYASLDSIACRGADTEIISSDFAGPGEIFNQTCSGVCYNDFVISEQYASLYSTAYFDVSYVRVYSSNPDVPSSLSTTGTPAGSSTQGGPPAPTNTNGSKSTVHFASLLQLGTLILGAAMALVAL